MEVITVATPKPKVTPKPKAKPKDCWDGYVRVPGTKPGTKGSCKKKSA
jgi:hypothetical protein